MGELPLKTPCGSCPYRKDVPAGIWALEEYAKLPEYDLPTAEQPAQMFACHQQNGHLCGGWVGTHDMENNLSVRLAASFGTLSDSDVSAILDYVPTVPLFASGSEAAAHGCSGIYQPGEKAIKTIEKLEKKRSKNVR